MTTEQANAEYDSVEEQIKTLERQISDAQRKADSARRAYDEHQAKTETYNGRLNEIMSDKTLDGENKRERVKQLRREIYGTATRLGVNLERSAVGAEDDVKLKEALLKKLTKKKEDAEREEREKQALRDQIQQLQTRLQDLRRFRTLGAPGPAPAPRRPASEVFVEDVDEEQPPAQRRRQDDYIEEEQINGLRLLSHSDIAVPPDINAFEEETNQSSSTLVPFVERPTSAPVIRQEGLFGTVVVRGSRKRSVRQDGSSFKSPATVTRDVLREETVPVPTISPVVRQMMHQNSNSLLSSIIYGNALPGPLRQPLPPFIQRDDYSLIPLRPEYEDEDL
jgi:hypothetical protein